MLEFSSLGSGSKGNGTLVRYKSTLLLVDCGFTLKETEKRLFRLGLQPEQLDAVLVTHEHSDHIAGVGPLARKYQIPVYMTAGTDRSRDLGSINQQYLIKNYSLFKVKQISVFPVAVPHDSAEPAQYVFEAGGLRLGLLTDLGNITPHVEKHYYNCDGLILEANYDPQMLASGDYPPALKQRVASAWGHLSNQQAADFITKADSTRLQQLVVGHISQKNNTVSLAAASLNPVIAAVGQVHYACQQQGFDWISLV